MRKNYKAKRIFNLASPIQSIKRSLFAKLLFAFLIMIIPIFSIGISVYNWGISAVKTEITNSKISQLEYNLRNLENNIEHIRMIQYGYLFDNKLIFIHNLTSPQFTYEKSNAIVKTREELLSMQNSWQFIKEIVVYFPRLAQKISSESGYEPMNSNDLIEYANSGFDTPANLYSQDGALYTNAIYPYFSRSDGTPNFSLRVELDQQEIMTWLNQFDYYHDGGSFVHWNTDQFPVFNTGESAIVQQIVDQMTKRNAIDESSKETLNIQIDKKRYLVTQASSEYLGLTLVNYVEESDIFQDTRTAQFRIFIFSIASIVVLLLFVIYLDRVLQKPLRKIIEAFSVVDSGSMDVQIESRRSDEFSTLYNHFNKMINTINDLIKYNYKQKLLLRNAELGQLQAQINPHFIYNSYFLLHRLIRAENYESSVQFSKMIGVYFQYITDNKPTATLERETEHAYIYAKIQAKRFEERVTVMLDPVPESVSLLQVPKLILQPILENSFAHAFHDKVDDGLLTVSYKTEYDFLYILIDDNGDTVDDKLIKKLLSMISENTQEEDSIGLRNIHKRLQLHFGENSGLLIERSDLGGLRITVRIFSGEGATWNV